MATVSDHDVWAVRTPDDVIPSISHTCHQMNNAGVYEQACVDIGVERLPIAAILNAFKLQDAEGSADVTTFDSAPLGSLDEMMLQSEHVPPACLTPSLFLFLFLT